MRDVEPRHGTHAMYVRLGCRCGTCRAYQSTRVAASRAARLAAGRLTHGNAGWDDGCRCRQCRHAHQRRYVDYVLRKDAGELS